MRCKRLLFCFFFVVWLLLEPWSRVLRLTHPEVQYFLASPPGYRLLAILAAGTVLATGVAYALASVWPARWRSAGYAFCLILMAYLTLPLVMPHIESIHTVLGRIWMAGCAACAAAALYLAVYKPNRLPLIFHASLAGAFGVFAAHTLTALSGAWFIEDLAGRAASRPQLPASRRFPENRVVWLIFDGFDYRLAFEQRPPGLHLPALDRLRQEALFAFNAYAPARRTIEALPGYLTGRVYREAVPAGPAQLRLFPAAGGEPELLQPSRTILGRLAAEGARVAVVGWYHPYCRLFAEAAVDCAWEAAPATAPLVLHEIASREPLPRTVAYLLSDHPLERLLPAPVKKASRRTRSQLELTVAARRHGEILTRLAPEAIRKGADASYDFVFVHLPVPHPPGIAAEAPAAAPEAPSGIAYLDNMMMADRFVGMLRNALESAGQWDSSHVIVTSDHGLRPLWADRPEWVGGAQLLERGDPRRVPLIVKLRGQSAPLQYVPEVPAVVLHDLALALAHGELNTPEGLTRWLSANRRRYPLSDPVTTGSGSSTPGGRGAGRP
jgi:hypothetical protein